MMIDIYLPDVYKALLIILCLVIIVVVVRYLNRKE